ncbi:MAG: ArnT family glycosyltransferase [Betaproteobacteria bacterium]
MKRGAWAQLAAAAAVAASFFWMLGAAPLFDVDEGAFSQATLEMFQRGDYLSTYLNGAPRYDKPILVYWLQAAAVALLGATETAFRLPSAICAALWAWMSFAFTRKVYGERPALLAAVMLATCLGVHIIGRAATADALLNCLIAAAMFSAWLHLSTGKRSWLYATHAAIGLGLLAKGPIAVLVPFAVTLVFCFFKRDLKTWLRAVFDWRALLLLLAIATPWYVAILHKEGWAFIDGFIMRHNVGRFGGPLQGHGGSLLYYFPVLLLMTLPFTAPLVLVARRWRDVWRDERSAYLLLWFLFVFAFFSLSGTKLPHYVLYGITGLVILMAVHGDGLRSAAWTLLPALAFLLALLFLPAALRWLSGAVRNEYYQEALAAAEFTPLYMLFFGVASVLLFYGMFERQASPVAKLAAAGAVASVGVASFVVPLAGALQQSPVKEAALLARAQKLEPVLWRMNTPSFSVYRGAPTATREPRPGDVVLTRKVRLKDLPPGTTHRILYSKNGVVLVRIGA